MARVPGLTHCEDDEAEWFFKSAHDLTVKQLELAQDIIAAGAANHSGAASPELLSGVVQAFAMNFAAIAISRQLPKEED